MGIFSVTGMLMHPNNPNRQRTIRFLVDAGALFSVVPRDVLSALRIPPTGEERVEFADGRRTLWKGGEMRLEINGRSVTTLVLFGKKRAQPLLGTYSLKGLRFSVDSAHHCFIPMPVGVVWLAAFNSRQRQLKLSAGAVGGCTLIRRGLIPTCA